MSKMKLRELGMDPMERLYYERKDCRKKAYVAKQKKARSRGRRVNETGHPLDVAGADAYSKIAAGPI